MKSVYITSVSKFLPNELVSNDEIENYLGLINGKPSKSKRIVLRNNGIQGRYYTLNQKGEVTHSNAQITAEAIRTLPIDLKTVQLLSCGTSTPDQMIPSHGVMVHGELGEQVKNIEVVSTSGVCCSGMHSLKYAFMAVKLGDVENAISTGSETISPLLKSSTFNHEIEKIATLVDNPYVSFEKDFLRWMLSDGAGAILLQNKPNENSLSLKIEWIEGVSYAHELETCMYMGAEKNEEGDLVGYMNYTNQELFDDSILSLKQDVKLLSSNIIMLGFDKFKDICEKRNLDISTISHFLPHMSSMFFKEKIYNKLVENGLQIPYEKWFTNLTSVGNVGSASIYLMLEELLKLGKLKKGEQIILAVPESARFSYMFSLLTVC